MGYPPIHLSSLRFKGFPYHYMFLFYAGPPPYHFTSLFVPMYSLSNRISVIDYVIYKNSTNPAKNRKLELPIDVDINQNDFLETGGFDVYGSQFVCDTQDGIYFAKNREKEKCLLDNEKIPQKFKTENQSTLYSYCEPRFLCKGTKAAASIYSDEHMTSVGLAIYDLETEQTHYYFNNRVPSQILYPYQDRYAVSKGSHDTIRLDAQTFNLKSFQLGNPVNVFYNTHDYTSLIISEYFDDTNMGLTSFKSDINDPANRSYRLLQAHGKTEAFFGGVTENYAVFYGKDIDGDWIAVVNYRDVLNDC